MRYVRWLVIRRDVFTAVTVVRVFAETDVAGDKEIRELVANELDALYHRSSRRVGHRASGILC